MKFKKDNRVLAYSEENEPFYLADGYDVVAYNEATHQYDMVKPATDGRTYSIAEYNELKQQNEALQMELARLEASKKKKTKASASSAE